MQNGEAFDMEREDLAGSTLVFGLDSIREWTELAGGSSAVESLTDKGNDNSVLHGQSKSSSR